MTTITNHVALTQLHTQLKATIANTDSHPSLIVGVLINLVAELIARNVTPVGIETVTAGTMPILRERVAHYLRQAAQDKQPELPWPESLNGGRLQ